MNRRALGRKKKAERASDREGEESVHSESTKRGRRAKERDQSGSRSRRGRREREGEHATLERECVNVCVR